MEKKPVERPQMSRFKEPAAFIRAMIDYRRGAEPGFSVYRATRSLRRVSPALVSLVMQNKRKVTLDRVDEFARLMNLNATEKYFFRSWLIEPDEKSQNKSPPSNSRRRKVTSTSILNDWINLYVKDLFLISAIQKNPTLIEKQMMGVANAKRIQKSIEFLLREGHLRRTLDGSIVIDTTLSVTDPGVPSRKIRQFHKGALLLARQGLDLYSTQERWANTLLVALDNKRHEELRQLVLEFAERLQDFAAQDSAGATRLYQVHVNLSPIGGEIE